MMIVLPATIISRSGFGRFGLGAADLTARLQDRNLQITARSDGARRILAGERIERGANHVVWVRRALRFRHDVVHAERLEHGAHRTAGDDAGPSRRGAQDDAAGAMAAEDVVMQRAALA